MSKIQGIIVHKFGGSSLQNAKAYQHISTLLKGHNEVIVVSAAANTTHLLHQLIDNAKAKNSTPILLNALKTFQKTLIADLLAPNQQESLLKQLEKDSEDIYAILHAIDFVKDYTQSMYDRILGYGELWSARLMAAYLGTSRKVIFLDATKVLFVNTINGIINIDWHHSRLALDYFLKNKKFDQLVITGFIASTPENFHTTLGHNGSDFSAAIFANLLNAAALIKWTDVDGIYSADPHRVKSAFVIETLSYEEALELAYFGTEIIHPQAIYPIIEKKIPLYIKNTNKPTVAGTYISSHKNILPLKVRGLSSIEHIALINIEGSGMIGVSGIAARVFKQLHLVNISIILISQASSEHSICFAVPEKQAELAVQVLKNQFSHEILQKKIENITSHTDCAILAAIGDNMINSPGVAGKLFNMLAQANINIRAISQGSSERNISIVINRHEINRALRVVHSGFYLSNKTISIGIIGPGNVGSTLIEQLNKEIHTLENKYLVNLRIRGIMNSSKMLLDENIIELTHWKKSLQDSNITTNFDKFSEHIISDDIPHAAIIDCSASQLVTDQYVNFFSKGLHVITPNKRANSGEFNIYQSLKAIAKKNHCHYLYETTVCAGLPVIRTLQDLIQTGDENITIEGIVSGTLAYIFDELSKGLTFSSVVYKAYELGYTEPDPRDDLSGIDVARKFTCLARELGFKVSLENIQVINLVPKELRHVSKEKFLKDLPSYDKDLETLIADKIQLHQKIRYVGTINNTGVVNVGIQAYSQEHPFFNLKGTDNILVFTTKRYHQFPLVIQGPGAGTEVTAAGIFADLLRLISFFSL